ncbi:CtrA inhibitor SciP [Geminicoccus roseus]|uniref:CtrA inhibitor SciP n=1 Tax=Geminicoccus roseus TaxID=404900 RepID=UPI0038993DAF
MTGTTIQVAVGPDGSLLRLEDLPPSDLQRWVARRKAEVVTAVQAGLLSLEAACARYNISAEEFEIWQTAIRRHGLGGLRVTRIQAIRRRDQDREAGAPALAGGMPEEARRRTSG